MKSRPNFRFNDQTSKSEIARILQNARVWMDSEPLNPTKKLILSACIRYGDENLAKTKLFAADKSRYRIVSHILEAAAVYDDIHFLACTIRELRQIGYYENSELRSAALPTAERCLDALLGPAVLRTQRMFLGALVTGLSLIVSRTAPGEGTAMLMLGVLGFLGSDYIVKMRVDRSLRLFENKLLTNNVDVSGQIQDGLNDEFSRLERGGAALLNGGFAFFERAAAPLMRLVNQPTPALANSNAIPRVEDVTEQDESSSHVMQAERLKK